MTMRLDLRTCAGTAWKPVALLSPTPFGCADCEQWFQFAYQLLQHVCEARDAR